MKDLNLVPTIELWRMADAEPLNATLQQAVAERKRQYMEQRRQNGKDSGSVAYAGGSGLFNFPFW